MNWMTSGRDRALRSTRGKKRRERNFPMHVQRQAVRGRAPLAPPAARPAEDEDQNATPAWYIRPILDANESLDVQLLEFAREAATGVSASAKAVAVEAAGPSVATSRTSETTQTTEVGTAQEKPVQERRCVFTPVKAKRSQRQSVSQRLPAKAMSPRPAGLLFFNEGEEVSKKTQPGPAQRQQSQQRPVPDPIGSIDRWLNDPSDSLAENTSICVKAQDEMPFYASSTPSSDDDLNHVGVSKHGLRGVHVDVELSRDDYRVESMHGNEGVNVRERNCIFDGLDDALSRNRCLLERNLAGGPGRRSVLGQTSSRPSADTGHEPMFGAFKGRNTATTPLYDPVSSHTVDNELWGSASRFPEKPSESKAVEPASDCNQRPISESSDIMGQQHPISHYAVEDGSSESSSSQRSLVLPPPINWQREIITRHAGSKYEAESTGTIGRKSEDSGDVPVQQSQPATTSLHGEELQPAWKCSSRTRRILNQIEREAPVRGQDNDPLQVISKLQYTLRKKEAAVCYMHALLLCHRVDEAFRFRSNEDPEILPVKA